jgi:hypothetical protein
MTNTARKGLGLRGFVFLLGLLGMVALVTGVCWTRVQLAAKHRPTVTGAVVDVSRFFLRSEENALFTIRYRYAVNGVAFERAEKVYTMTDRDGRHPFGMHDWTLSPSIVVYYDPTNPARATIEAGLQTESMLLVCFGFVILGISIAVLLPRRRASRIATSLST